MKTKIKPHRNQPTLIQIALQLSDETFLLLNCGDLVGGGLHGYGLGGGGLNVDGADGGGLNGGGFDGSLWALVLAWVVALMVALVVALMVAFLMAMVMAMMLALLVAFPNHFRITLLNS